MAYSVTRPYAHIERGIVRAPANALTLVIEYPEVSNSGDLAGRLGLKVNLVETKAFFDDTWVRYTSRTDDPDKVEDRGEKPGVIRDKVARDTGFQFLTQANHFPALVVPGASVLHLPTLVLSLPGAALGPAIDEFWAREGAIDFKLIVWLFELDASGLTIPHDGPIGSIDRHEFPRAFRVEP